MILFTSDYTEGAHPRIIEKLAETNMEQTVGYGEDPYCEEAREAIKKVCEAPEADVHFLVGGTQTNFTVISSILRPFQGVIRFSNMPRSPFLDFFHAAHFHAVNSAPVSSSGVYGSQPFFRYRSKSKEFLCKRFQLRLSTI